MKYQMHSTVTTKSRKGNAKRTKNRNMSMSVVVTQMSVFGILHLVEQEVIAQFFCVFAPNEIQMIECLIAYFVADNKIRQLSSQTYDIARCGQFILVRIKQSHRCCYIAQWIVRRSNFAVTTEILGRTEIELRPTAIIYQLTVMCKLPNWRTGRRVWSDHRNGWLQNQKK